MKHFLYFFALITLLFGCKSSPKQTEKQTDILVAGGGASGIAAAVQAARDGMNVIVVEETEWLGGMLTAAGVSAIDGNHQLPSGLWGEFREALRKHYGGAAQLETGWVSNTLFEPKVGEQVWRNMADQLPNLTRIHGYHPVEVLKEGNRVTGVVFEKNDHTERLTVRAQITIEATELGDLLPLAGARYFVGQDDPQQEGQPMIGAANDLIQDITYAATLQDFGEGADRSVPMPEGFDASVFDCTCKEVCSDTVAQKPHPCQTMITYGKLPNGKYMINWPIKGNDYYANVIEMSYDQRQEVYKAAKRKTLAYIAFMQQELGWKHLGLAENEYPSADGLPLIPYHREARRVAGLVQLQVRDLLDPYADPQRAFYQQAVCVGDYPLDHHHKELADILPEDYPAIPSYSVPYGALVPESVDGLLVAEKSISATHMTNGASRLQPVVIQLGQVAGAAAALCVQQGLQPRQISVSGLQDRLLMANMWLLPFMDTQPQSAFFIPLQKMGLTGIIRGQGVPHQWANRTYIYPDSVVNGAEMTQVLERTKTVANLPGAVEQLTQGETFTVADALVFMAKLEGAADTTYPAYLQSKQGLRMEMEKYQITPESLLDRKVLAFLLFHAIHV